MVLAGNPTYPQCHSQWEASLGNIPIPAFRQIGCPHYLPPVMLWLNAIGILCGAFCPRGPPPQCCERPHVSPVYTGLGTSHAYPETYPNGSCSCIKVGHHLPPSSVCQYLTPACGWPLTPTGEPPWPPGGLYHVGSLSPRTGSGMSFGSWAAEWLQQSHFGPTWQYSLAFVNGSSGKTGCL